MILHDSLRHRARAFSAVKVCRAILVCAVAAAALLAALAAPPALAQSQTQYLYVVSNGVSTYSVDATTGALTLVNAAPTSSAPVLAGPLVINSAGTYLFNIGLNSANQGAVFVYSIAPNGSLQQTAASPFAISQPTGTPFALALSQNGNYLYVLSSYPATQPQPGNDTQYTEIFVDVFSVAADGTLTIANTIPIPDPDYCNSDLMASTTPVAFDVHPAQKWIYVSMSAHEAGGSLCTGEPSAIQQLIINADGTLSDGQLYVLGTYSTPVSGFASSPDGTQLFMLGGLSLTPFLNAIAINPVSGQLNGSSDYTTSGSYNGALAVDWSSSYLYNSTFGTFSISDGNLQLLSNPPPQAPTGLATSSIVPFLFNLEDGEVGVYQVGAGDTLTQVSGSPFTVTQGTQVLSGSPALVDTAVLWVSPGESVGFGGPVQVGQSTTYPVGLTNQGYGPLTVSNVSVSGDPSFSVTNTCSAPVAPAANCIATVKFAPTEVGTFTGTLTLTTNVSTRTLSISGTAIAAPPPTPDPVLVAPSPILFPDTTVGSSSPLTFQLKNGSTGTGPMTVSSVTITGSNTGDFTASNTCSAPVPVGSACTVTVTFAPLALGARAAILNINGPSGALISSNLTGTAVTTVTKYTFTTSVTGPGTITQTPTGTSFANNTTVNLTAVPNTGAMSTAWGGACTGSGGNSTCSVVVTANTTVSAAFNGFTLATSVIGPGTITQSPSGTTFPPGTEITLTAVPGTGATFTNWSGGECNNSTNPTCIFSMVSSVSVTATFAPPQYELTTAVSGPGTIAQSPTGSTFSSGTAITLTAVPNTGATFTSWSGGACSGSTSTTCMFNISANTSVTATFAGAPAVTVPNPSQSGTPGSAFTFALSTSGFSTPPTLKASCAIPEGTCTISGTTLTVTTTAAPARAIHETPASVAAWPTGGGSGDDFKGVARDRELAGHTRGKGARADFGGLSAIVGPLSTMSLPMRVVPLPTRTLLAAMVAMVIAMLATFAMWMGGAPLGRRMRLAFAPLAMFAMVAGLALLAACGGGGGGGGGGQTGTPAGTYTVTVTATAGTQTATTNVSVTVQ